MSVAASSAGFGMSATGPLAGVRVLELAQIMAGPTCGVMLADLGADVVKVEKLPGGDDSRGYREPRVNGISAPFMMMSRGKRGIALDLKRPEGRAILLRMVRTADVLLIRRSAAGAIFACLLAAATPRSAKAGKS